MPQPPADSDPAAATASRTARAVALVRAELDRPHSPHGDPDAQARLCAGLPGRPAPGLRPWVRARTRFIDQALLDALAAGVEQCVILGAGYDDRALRFAHPAVRFVELDHPATQADKARRLAALAPIAAPTLVPIDLARAGVAAALDRAGHDPGRATVFIGEAVLIYLDPALERRLLGELRARAAVGSVLVLSLATLLPGEVATEVLAAANARRRSGTAEPWRTIRSPANYRAELAAAGWRLLDTVDAADLDPDAIAGRRLLVTATPV